MIVYNDAMYFENEEKMVSEQFMLSFKQQADTLISIHKLIEEFLHNSSVAANDYAKYSAVILAGSSFKSLIGSYDRLRKGYLTDSETLLKKTIESIFYQLYFHEHPAEAKRWCQTNNKPELGQSRYKELAKILDQAQVEKNFFPTDYENFFEKYLYKVGYVQANRLAHLDFDMVHFEIGLENTDPSKFATTMVLGPKFEESMMQTTLNRLIMISMFQTTIILYITDQQPSEEYREVFSQFRELWNEDE